jgi:hypothetical protein
MSNLGNDPSDVFGTIVHDKFRNNFSPGSHKVFGLQFFMVAEKVFW